MYGAADAFVLPTAELECFGLIAIEALACGRPALATPVGAVPEVVGQIESHWLAQDNSEKAIPQLLIDFLQGNLPLHTPVALREIVANRFSQKRMLGKMAQVLLEPFQADTTKSVRNIGQDA